MPSSNASMAIPSADKIDAGDVEALAENLVESAMKEAVKSYIAAGFTAVKFGWGVFGRDMCTDIKLVEAAREELGSGRDLLVDTGWFVERTPKEAIQVVRALEPFQPYLIEELLHPEDYDQWNDYDRIAAAINARAERGSLSAIVVVAEGACPRDGQIVMRPNQEGEYRLGGIGDWPRPPQGSCRRRD